MMSRISTMVPAETDLLCESCGYVLNGLPATSNCPECGKPIAESLDENRRQPTAWERQGAAGLASTTMAVLFRPARFYRSLQTRLPAASAFSFARVHWIIASVLFAAMGFLHADWYVIVMLTGRALNPALMLLLALLIYAALSLTTTLAAKLTAWEAAYRGLRVPESVALRGLYFHAAHYVPVALIALLTVAGYRWAIGHNYLPIDTAAIYLYVLCAEVVLGAAYLFQTYWIGMRNVMYANR